MENEPERKFKKLKAMLEAELRQMHRLLDELTEMHEFRMGLVELQIHMESVGEGCNFDG